MSNDGSKGYYATSFFGFSHYSSVYHTKYSWFSRHKTEFGFDERDFENRQEG
jgi:hypothetical protein